MLRVLSQNGLSAIFDISKVRAPLYNTKQYFSNDKILKSRIQCIHYVSSQKESSVIKDY